MSRLEDVSTTAQRTLFVLIAAYFALVVYANAASDPTASLASDLLFALIALALGGVLYRASSDGFSPTVGAAACFVAAGIAQLGALTTSDVLLALISDVGVLAGLVLYLVAVRRR